MSMTFLSTNAAASFHGRAPLLTDTDTAAKFRNNSALSFSDFTAVILSGTTRRFIVSRRVTNSPAHGWNQAVPAG